MQLDQSNKFDLVFLVRRFVKPISHVSLFNKISNHEVYFNCLIFLKIVFRKNVHVDTFLTFINIFVKGALDNPAGGKIQFLMK